MPELPEVETMRRGIEPIAGSRIEDVWCPRLKVRPLRIDPPLARLRDAVIGQRIQRVGRAGKRVVLELEQGSRIVIEPRMTGRILLTRPPDESHLRVVFELADGPAAQLLFWDSRGLGVVRLMSPAEFARELGEERLGPDALEVTAEQLRDRLAASRREIKVALMDQRTLAGVGNLYASEILHRAGVHPRRTCDRLRPADWRRLHATLRQVLEDAIKHQGSTLSDGMYRDAQNEAGGYQAHHLVYQRAGSTCTQCEKGVIQRIVQAQRSTFFCPRCQRAR